MTTYLAPRLPAGSTVFGDWMSRMLLEGDYKPGARYSHLWYFGNYDNAPIDYCNVLLQDLDQRQPVYIILPKDMKQYFSVALDSGLFSERPRRASNLVIGWKRLDDYVAEHYSAEKDIGYWHSIGRSRRNERDFRSHFLDDDSFACAECNED